MKKSLLILSLGLMGLSALAQNPTTFNCVADTWLRSNNDGFKGGSSDKLEIRMDAIKDGDGNPTGEYAYFVGLVGFNYSVPSGMKVSSATLRLVTERYKGSKQVSLYGYTNNFDENNATWATEGSYVEDALLDDSITDFTPQGQWNKSLAGDELSEEYQEVGAWTNEINVTAYLKSLPVTSTRVNFLLAPADADSESPSTNQNCFFSNNAEGLTNSKVSPALTIDDSDLVPELYVTFVEDSASSSDLISPAGDTYVRSNAATQNNASNVAIEIYNYQPQENGVDSGDYVWFVGLMNFQLPGELLNSNYELKGASLRLVSTMIKSNRQVGVYKYGSFSETSASWETIGTDVLAALEEEPLFSFEAAGQGNSALGSGDAIKDDYSTIDKWTNNIDLTTYAQDILDAGSANLTFMLSKMVAGNAAIKFATSNAADLSGNLEAGGTYTIPAADLVPQLTVVYEKKNSTGVKEIITSTIDLNAPVEYYDLSGRRVANPDKGVYIMRQGDKAIKVIK